MATEITQLKDLQVNNIYQLYDAGDTDTSPTPFISKDYKLISMRDNSPVTISGITSNTKTLTFESISEPKKTVVLNVSYKNTDIDSILFNNNGVSESIIIHSQKIGGYKRYSAKSRKHKRRHTKKRKQSRRRKN